MTSRKRKIQAENGPEEREPVNKNYKDTGHRINRDTHDVRLISAVEAPENPSDMPVLEEPSSSPDLYREIPIVVLSDDISTDMTDRVKALQIQHVIQKPYNSEYLKKNVNSLLEIEKKKSPQL